MLPEALETARKAAEERPDDLYAQLAYACCADFAGDVALARDQLTRCLALPIPEVSVNLQVLFHRAVVNVKLGDLQSSVEDLVREIELSGVPFGHLTRPVAIVSRSLIRHASGDGAGAAEDYREAFRTEGLSGDDIAKLFSWVLPDVLERRGAEAAVDVVDALIARLSAMPPINRVEIVARIATLLAEPGLREFWPSLIRRLHGALPEEAQAISFFLPVAEVLEGKGRKVLDSLPPQERGFALEVLERLEPKPEVERSPTP